MRLFHFFISLFVIGVINCCVPDTPNEPASPPIVPYDSNKTLVQHQILYLSTKETTNRQIYLMNCDGSNQRRISHDNNDYTYIAFSPDGTKIIANSFTPTQIDDLFLMNLDGSQMIQLTTGSGENNLPDFSPDGTKIVFTSTRDGNREVYLMNVDGNNQNRLTNNELIDYAPQFINDGANILYLTLDNSSNEFNIFIMNCNGSNKVCLTEGKEYKHRKIFFHESSTEAHFIRPEVSPDGSKIAFVTYNYEGESPQIRIMNSDGTNHYTLTGDYEFNIEPHFSLHGDFIYFVSHKNGKFDIYRKSVAEPDEPLRVQINPDLGHSCHLSLSPDRQKIIFISDPYGLLFHIYTMKIDGSNLVKLTNGSYQNYLPKYQPLYND